MKILAIDLGSRKSVFGISGALGDKAQYGSLDTTPQTFHDLITTRAPDRIGS